MKTTGFSNGLASANLNETNKTKQNKIKSAGFVPRQNKTRALESQPLKNGFLSCFFFLCGKLRLFNKQISSFQQCQLNRCFAVVSDAMGNLSEPHQHSQMSLLRRGATC